MVSAVELVSWQVRGVRTVDLRTALCAQKKRDFFCVATLAERLVVIHQILSHFWKKIVNAKYHTQSPPSLSPTMYTLSHVIAGQIGLGHEHQHPSCPIEWNVPAVYEYCSGPPNYWSKEKTERNILNRGNPSPYTLFSRGAG